MSIIYSIYKRYIKFKVQHSNSQKQIELLYKYFGIKVGKNFRLLGWPHWGSEPYLIEIGDNVTLSQNIVFHTHDGGVGLFRNDYAGINVFGKIVIGNNVFIGANSTILAGVNIGDNVVIGAGSMVTKDIPSNNVFAGVPAKFIRSLEDYKERSLKKAIFIYETDKKKRKEEILRKIKNS